MMFEAVGWPENCLNLKLADVMRLVSRPGILAAHTWSYDHSETNPCLL